MNSIQKEREAFEAWYFRQNHLGIDPIDHARESYKAGAASRQAEINELQKRIDEAMKYVSESPLKDVSRRAMLNFLDILKGKQNDQSF